MVTEKEQLKREVADLKLEIAGLSKKIEEVKSEAKKKATELEKVKGEHFVATKKLSTIESEYQVELQSLQAEVEDLQHKLRASEQKEVEEDNYSTGEGADGFEENFAFDDLMKGADAAENRSRGSTDHRRMSMIIKPPFLPSHSIGRKRNSIVETMNGGEVKEQLMHDTKLRELQDKVSELTQALHDSKLAIASFKREAEELQAKLKDETRRVDIGKRKFEEKTREFDLMMKRFLEDNDKYTQSINELNEELEVREEMILKLKRQVSRGHQAPVQQTETKPKQPAEQTAAKPSDPEKGFFDRFF
jgi:chromosome segregation ATPase